MADARGTGASFGVHNGPFSVEETADGYEIIEWLSGQPWPSGKVGMAGRSYPGTTQYLAATQRPPHLVAIFAEMAVPSPYDFAYQGGTYKTERRSLTIAGADANNHALHPERATRRSGGPYPGL